MYRRKLLLSLIACILLIPCTWTPVKGQEASNPDLETMIGQMVMVGFRGLDFDPDSRLAEYVKKGMLGGVVLFDRDVAADKKVRNILNAKQVRSLVKGLQSRSSIPLFIAIDQEGGKVCRLKEERGFPPTYSAAELGKKADPDFTRAAAAKIGKTLAGLGINLDLAPVVDVNVNPENPAIGKLERSFSAEPQKVARQARAFVQGLHEQQVLSCLKHFPGHGSAWNDSHYGLTDITETWSRKELLPYKRLIAGGYSDAIMTGHLFNADLDAKLPATLSEPTIKGLLRRDMGYNGVVISDDMQMRAIRDHYELEETVLLAVRAGVDILLFGNNLEYDPRIAGKVNALLLKMVREGELERSRIAKSYERIMKLKSRLAF
mgnify:CR=1 FL=1